jgi:hypothetical protein
MAVLVAAAAAGAVAATILILLPANGSGAPPAATRLLAKIAYAAEQQPVPRVRDSPDINIANGSIFGVSAVLQRAFVNHAGQLPR